MGLFSTLTSSAAAEGGKTRNSTLDIQNVIQLYAGNKPILVEKNATVRKFSVLSYQTVHVTSSAAQEGGALLSNMEKEATSLHPNLGVWNCRITKNNRTAAAKDEKPLADEIFSTLPQSDTHPAICMAVDLSNLAQVEPTISLLQDALVRYLIARPTVTGMTTAATTSLFDLRSTHFGLATNDEESAKSMSKSTPEEGDKKITVSLAISVLLPSRNSSSGEGDDTAGNNNNNDEYKDKQAEALVVYHLRKYAASLNAVLCFARKDKAVIVEGDDKESKGIDALTLHQLSFVWQQIAKGEDGWKELDHSSNTTEGEAEPAASTSVSGIYGPGHHHEDLIESVLLRNAQFPGQWDAAKDSLWVALPPPAEADATDDETTDPATTSGDEGWLNELRSSVASEAKTPPPKDAKKGDAADAKTPGDADVSSFFESLLKP